MDIFTLFVIAYCFGYFRLIKILNKIGDNSLYFFYHDISYQDIYNKLGSKPCIRIRKIFDMDIEYNCTETCIRIITGGRFGNHFNSFCTALFAAKTSGLKTIYVTKGFLLLPKSFVYDDIFIKVKEKKFFRKTKINCFSHKFFAIGFRNLNSSDYKRLGSELRQDFATMFINSLPHVVIPNNSLVVHFRSGDIFNDGWVSRFYGQPPCNYYLDAIRSRNWSKVILVSEDRKNPCVNVVEKVAGEYKQRSFEEDLAIMLNAENFVISKGTLCKAIITISRKIKNVFAFHDARINKVNTFVCIATNTYAEVVLKKWFNNQIQREMILNSSCVRWEFFPKV